MAAPGVIKCFGPKVTLKKRKRYFAVLRVVAYERSVDVRCLCSNVESTDGETTMRTNGEKEEKRDLLLSHLTQALFIVDRKRLPTHYSTSCFM